MNIIEAIKKGRPFYRAGDTRRFLPGKDLGLRASYSYGDLVAEDWECLPPEVLITPTKFWDAANQVIEKNHDDAGLMSTLCRLLGLEE